MDCFAIGRTHRFIGVFDTGAGGLNLLRECRRTYPCENYLYFADNLNAPYGGYGEDKIRDLVAAAAAKMDKYGLKALLLACNTATSAAAESLRKTYGYPVIGMEPAVKPAASIARGKDILLLCTPATARQEKLAKLLRMFAKNKVIIAPQPDWAADIENNLENLDAIRDKIKDALTPHLNRKPGAVVLGCTHYIFIKDMISEISGGLPVFDGAEGTVKNLFGRLQEEALLTQNKEKGQLLIVTTAPAKTSYWNLAKL